MLALQALLCSPCSRYYAHLVRVIMLALQALVEIEMLVELEFKPSGFQAN
jgi:hypothetical protein